MKKKVLSALTLILAFLIGLASTGCSAGSRGIVVGRVGTENVTAGDVAVCAGYTLLNSGYTLADLTAEQIAGLNASSLDTAIQHKLILQKAAMRGLYPLSEENQKIADDNYNQFISSIAASGMDLSSYGMTEEDVRTLMTFFEASDALMAEVTKDTAVTDEEIKAEYDRLLSEQQQSYDSDPTAYDGALSGGAETVVYRPKNYRYIKHILIAMPQDIASQISAASSSGDTETVAKLRGQGLPQIEAKANEVLAKVQGGGDFDALISEFNEDPGMQAEPAKAVGYQVGAKSSFVPEFLEAAMGLAKVGDTTGLVATDFGYHILKYVGDVPAGAIALSEVKDGISASLLVGKKSDEFNALVDTWTKETTIKKNANKIP